jgi:predicted house-cleaning noncanonical NTP pyrophosphatase (MazG superfamily)
MAVGIARTLSESAQWIDRQAILAAEIRALRAAWRRAFRQWGERLVARLGEIAPLRGFAAESFSDADIQRAIDEELATLEAELSEVFVQAALRAMREGRNSTLASLPAQLLVGVALDMVETPETIAFLREQAATMIRRVSESTRDQVRKIIVDATDAGEGWPAIAQKLRERFAEFTTRKPQEHIRDRADLIAVTEMGNAFEEQQLRTLRELEAAGLRMEKAWQTVGDERVSELCERNQSAGWIETEQAFPSGHLRPLRFPGCRCAMLTRLKQ